MSLSFSGYSRGCGVQIQSVLVWILIIFFSGVTTTTDYNSRHYSQPLVSYWTVNAVCVCVCLWNFIQVSLHKIFFFFLAVALFSSRVYCFMQSRCDLFFSIQEWKRERKRERERKVSVLFLCADCAVIISFLRIDRTHTQIHTARAIVAAQQQ